MAQEFIANPANYTLDREKNEFLKSGTFYGNELVLSMFNLALMNLYPHSIGNLYGIVPIKRGNLLLTDLGTALTV